MISVTTADPNSPLANYSESLLRPNKAFVLHCSTLAALRLSTVSHFPPQRLGFSATGEKQGMSSQVLRVAC